MSALIMTPLSAPAAVGVYIDQSNLEDKFGINNIEAWSQLDNDVETADTARIQKAIDYAESKINDAFRGSRYAIPFASAPEQIKEWATTLAGIWLYQSRGLRDTNEEGDKLQALRDDTDKAIVDCAAGKTRLDAARYDGSVPTAPTMII